MTPVFAQHARGDRAFERLYRRHAGDVYRYAYAVLQNSADAEDVTQTTFLNAYRALERGERPDRPHNWLIAIAHNVCRQRFRQSQRRPSEVEWNEDLPDRLVEDDEGPTAEDIRRALGHLPFNQRAALVMRELEGRSYAEIGELLELSTGAVETLIFRARRALREQLEGSLTCGEAELAISRQLDGRLGRAEKGALRAHLRECPECAVFARRQRAQRSALRSLGAIPLPASLSSLFGGGTAGVVAAKTAAVVAAAAMAGGAGYEAVRSVDRPASPRPHRAAATTDVGVRPAASATASGASGAGTAAPSAGRGYEGARRDGRDSTRTASPERGAAAGGDSVARGRGALTGRGHGESTAERGRVSPSHDQQAQSASHGPASPKAKKRGHREHASRRGGSSHGSSSRGSSSHGGARLSPPRGSDGASPARQPGPDGSAPPAQDPGTPGHGKRGASFSP